MNMKNVLSYLEKAYSLYPNKVAIAYKDEKFTYKELVELSRSIGSRLKTSDYRNQPIGVMAYHSIYTIAFFFGILYSGNYYIPIDPEMTKEKIESIVNDAKIPLILEESNDVSLYKRVEYTGEYLQLHDFDTIKDCSLSIPDIWDDDPIYMIYTSGSTGKPKGVLKSHKAVMSYIEAYVETFDFNENEVIGNQAPFFFDASAKDIYLMIKLGCTMEILPSSLFSLPPELMEYLNNKKVTFISWVPTAFSLVAQLNPFSLIKPETLKKAFFVGEVMPMKHLNAWRKALPDIQYVNLYGSSEIAGICCFYPVEGTYSNDSELPMGKPLKNCEIYLVDKDNVITECNHVGEIYIVSDALALEYFNDLEKTNKSFLIRDFGNGPVRCFKTGDLAQYDIHGNLVFAARTDYQIKHMGHRIELGEIESVAGALEEINRCCCLYNAAKRKIMLFCELNDETISSQQIRSTLRKKLSSYMVPQKVIIMDHLPINQNGKIDRQKLKEQL